MSNNNKISKILSEKIPNYIKELYGNDSGEATFILFMKAYYEFLEKTGNPDHLIKSSKDFFDVDSEFFRDNFSKFQDYFFKQFLPGIPKSVLVDKKFLLKHGREFYLNKGNENSFKFLFKILYNEDIEIFIPHTKVLTASDSNKGLLSEDCKLHDSFFWQQFSYQISSGIVISEYKDIVLKLIHPAGLKMFGKFLTEIEITKISQAFASFSVTFIVYAFSVYSTAHTELIKKLDKDYLSTGNTYYNILDLINTEQQVSYIYAYASIAYSGNNTVDEVYLKNIGIDYPTNSLNGWYIAFINGTGDGQIKLIDSWENFNTYIKVTVDSSLSTAADSDSEFILFKEIPSNIGKAQSGSNNTIELSSVEYSIDDFYNDRYSVRILAGTGAGQTKQITDYNGTTKVATVVSNWSTNPDATSVYVIEKFDGNETDYFKPEFNLSVFYELHLNTLTDPIKLKKKYNLAETEIYISK